MPNIKLSDQAGLDIDVTPAPDSALLRYLQQIPSLKLDALDFKKIGGLTLAEPAVKSLASGVAFDQPVALGDRGLNLSIGVAAHASLQFGASPRTVVPDLVEPGGTFVRFGIEASASADLTGKQDRLHFGASPSASLQLDSYA